MNDDHKRKLREARYKATYGDKWEEVLRLRDETKAIERAKLQGKVKTLANGEGLSKSEFLRLVAARMRGFTANPKEFLALANLYAEVKKWTEAPPKKPELSAGDLISGLEKLTKEEEGNG